jgi:hypothetical protein
MFLMPLQIIIRNWQALGVTAVVFAISMVGMYKFWYKNLPPEPAKVNKSNGSNPEE